MKTYVMGTNAIFYDSNLLKVARDTFNAIFWWKLSWVYFSNWRVLHIDGLEGSVYNRNGIPGHQGYKIKFTFHTPEAA